MHIRITVDLLLYTGNISVATTFAVDYNYAYRPAARNFNLGCFCIKFRTFLCSQLMDLFKKFINFLT